MKTILRSVSVLLVTFAAYFAPMTSATTTAGAALIVCSASDFTGTPSVVTMPGGTHVTWTLTESKVAGCDWNSLSGAQWLSGGHEGIGPVLTLANTPQTALTLGRGMQVRITLATMEGVQCSVQSATAVSLIAGGRFNAALPTPVSVCVGGATQWSTAVLSVVPVAPCTNVQASVGRANGAAGTIWYPVILVNKGAVRCQISGLPTIQPVSNVASASSTVGPAARTNLMESVPVLLLPGGAASAGFGVGETGNYSASTCAPGSAKAIVLTLGAITKTVPLSISVCTALASTSVNPFVAGRTGTN
jgi:Protein of unknown function (DUF4232)